MDQPQFVLWDPRLFLGVTVGVLAVIFIGSAYKTNELAGGGGSVATLMGGRLVNPNTTDPDERKLLNVVEEMAIASGVPVPQVYVLDRNAPSMPLPPATRPATLPSASRAAASKCFRATSCKASSATNSATF